MVAALTPAVPDRLARLYGVPWITSGIRVDVVRVANREGAFTSIDPAPAHITISSGAPALREWVAAEVLLHETSHALAFPLMDDFAAELRMQRKASWHLWHVALFYLTGEVVRQALAERGIQYETYMYKTGLFERAWPEFRAPIETYWKPYVNGEVSRDEAIRNVVRASKGIEMSVADYFIDVIVRWRLWDVAAILAIALWTAFALRPASSTPMLLVLLLVTACPRAERAHVASRGGQCLFACDDRWLQPYGDAGGRQPAGPLQVSAHRAGSDCRAARLCGRPRIGHGGHLACDRQRALIGSTTGTSTACGHIPIFCRSPSAQEELAALRPGYKDSYAFREQIDIEGL
jgi:hypothetical protein